MEKREIMRKLLWFTVGFGAACWACAYFLWHGPLFLLAGVALGTAFATALCARKFSNARVAALILLGLAGGFGWFGLVQNYYLFPLQALDGETVSMTITSSGYSQMAQYSAMVEGWTEYQGKSYKVRTYLKGDPQIEPGDRLTGNFRIRLTTPEGMKDSNSYRSRGIFLIGSQNGEAKIVSGEKRIRFLPARLSRHAREILSKCLPEDAFPFAQALMLGDTSELDYVTTTSFSVSGVRHLVAVSGLHAAILYGLLMAITGRQRYVTALLGIPAMIVFAGMAGFTPSVSRATIMICLMMLAGVLDRDYDTATELAFACLVLMMVNPMIIGSGSYQMSVVSVVGILVFSPKILEKLNRFWNNPKKKTRHWINRTISVTLSATLASTPLAAYYFHTVSLISPLTNLMTVWIVGLVFYGILTVCLMGSIWLPAGICLGWLLAWPIRYVLFVARMLASIPMAAVYTRSEWVLWWLILSYILLADYMLVPSRKLRYYVAASSVLLCGAMVVSAWLPRQDSCRLTVLDVGQGQSLLFQSKGHSFLVDCGGYSDSEAANAAAETLLSQSVYRLDGILLTHYDSDHMGGIPDLLTRVKADWIYLPSPEEDDFAASVEAVSDARMQWVENGRKIQLGEAEITMLDSKTGKSNNENSVGILFETQNCVILVTGDRSKAGEKALLKLYDLPDVDVLIAGHHGSKNSTSEELLNAIRPETVMISVGRNNSYGHPAPETMERLEQYGCTVYRTDEMGTIVYTKN